MIAECYVPNIGQLVWHYHEMFIDKPIFLLHKRWFLVPIAYSDVINTWEKELFLLPVVITQELEEKRRKQAKLTEKAVSTAMKHAQDKKHGRAKMSTAVLNSNSNSRFSVDVLDNRLSFISYYLLFLL